MQSSPAMLVRSAIMIGFLIVLPVAALLGGPRLKSLAQWLRAEEPSAAGLTSAVPHAPPSESKLTSLTAGPAELSPAAAPFPQTHAATPPAHAWPAASAAAPPRAAAPTSAAPLPVSGLGPSRLVPPESPLPQVAVGPQPGFAPPVAEASPAPRSLAMPGAAPATFPRPEMTTAPPLESGGVPRGVLEPLPPTTPTPPPWSSAPPPLPAAALHAPPATAAQPVGHLAPAGSTASPATDQFAWVQWRLRELGAVHYVLETWGSEGRLFRFQCQVASPAAPAHAPRHFEATDGDPLRAMMLVLEQVEQTRPLPGP